MNTQQAALIREAVLVARRNSNGRRVWLREKHRSILEKRALNSALMNLINNYKRQHGLP